MKNPKFVVNEREVAIVVSTAPEGGKMKIVFATVLLLVEAFSSTAFAFNVDGFFSGMTIPQLAAYANTLGLTATHSEVDPNPGSWDLVSSSGEIVDSFDFCGGGMSRYVHPVSFDIEYAKVLAELLSSYGQPTVLISRSPLIYDLSSTMPLVIDKWKVSDEVVQLTFTPELHDSAGKLRLPRTADVDYQDDKICPSVGK
jgi:hypothetical protein